MKTIKSFQVNHDTLTKGMYISRIDGDCITYDIRMVTPNGGIYLENDGLHTFEHLFATYVRNSDLADQIIYAGPMGCQTGFYLLVRNACNSQVIAVIKDVLQKIISYQGEVFGASEIECGNYRSLDLSLAQQEAERYLNNIRNITENDLKY